MILFEDCCFVFGENKFLLAFRLDDNTIDSWQGCHSHTGVTFSIFWGNLSWGAIIGFFLGLFVVYTEAQTFDETWTLTANGQTVKANPDGSFFISNIAAPDFFWLGGPGTRPDFRSDDFIRVTGVGQLDGIPFYVFSEPFQFSQGQIFTLSEDQLTFAPNPPSFPESLRNEFEEIRLTTKGTKDTKVKVRKTRGACSQSF